MKKIIHILHTIKHYLISVRAINKLFSNSKGNRIILIGSPEHQNIGDHAISIAEISFFDKYFKDRKVVEITGNLFRKSKGYLKNKINNNDVIVITGGGLMGDLWIEEEEMIENALKMFSSNKIIIMPQTIYFSDATSANFERLKGIINSCNNLTIFCREKNTYDFVKTNFTCACVLSPDMVLFFEAVDRKEKRQGVLACFREDNESRLEKKNAIMNKLSTIDAVCKFSTVKDYHISVENRECELESVLSQLSKARLLVTDRLHAMIFACVTKTPCVAFDNISKKVSGVGEWLKDCDYIRIIEDESQLDEAIKAVLNVKTSSDSIDLEDYYKEMASLFN